MPHLFRRYLLLKYVILVLCAPVLEIHLQYANQQEIEGNNQKVDSLLVLAIKEWYAVRIIDYEENWRREVTVFRFSTFQF